jgi:hypothetical protein
MSQRYAGGIITANQNANFSGRFSGLNSSLSFPGASQYAIATSTTPFTIEAWIKPITAGGVIFSEEFPSAPINIVCSLVVSNEVFAPTGLFPAFGFYTAGAVWVTAAASTTPVVLNTWTHVAFVFTGSTSKIYINGIDVTKPSSPTPATTWGVTANNGTTWFIGRRWDTGGAGIYWNGSINNFRFVNGTAVYTANFTPPTNLTPIANTVMLTCQGPAFIDASSYAATITNNGGVIVGTDNPFYTQPSPALGAATPGVWELNESAAAAAQRSWPMYDPFFNLTNAMVHGNGTNGGTNNTFLDSSTNNFAVTRNGNTTQGTFTPYSQPSGYWSNFFDGTGDYLQVAGSSNLAFGTGNFTIECFFWANNLQGFIYDSRTASSQACPTIFFSGTTIIYYVSGANRIVSSSVIVRRWYHLVVSRVSGNTRMFLDGVQTGSTYVDSTTYINNTNRPYIGINGDGASSGFSGYISNLRVLNGTGTTAPVVPTAPLTPVSNTQLLTCQSNRFVDNSANAFAITKFADARTLLYSPLYYPTFYTPEARGGAMYFDGTGDYLTLTGSSNLAFGTSDFSIECWVYMTAFNASASVIYDTRPAATTTGTYPRIQILTASGRFEYLVGTTSAILSNTTTVITTNQWFHVVVSRVSTTTRMFINGVAQTATYADTQNYLNGANRPIIATEGNSVGNDAWDGFIADFRIIKGSGVTSVTVPTQPLTAITNTQLLLSGTNASFIDNATNLTIETVNTSISTAQSKYGSGSMLFNGTSAYANLISPFGNGANLVQTINDFTVEAWINPTTVTAQQTIFCVNGNTTGFAGCRLDINTTGGLQLLVSTNGTTHAINSANTYATPTGVWTHVAVSRQGNAYVVYLNGSPVITSTAVGIASGIISGTISAIGAVFNLSWSGFFNGYISDFRITNYARYLGVFTPPTSTLQNQ